MRVPNPPLPLVVTAQVQAQAPWTSSGLSYTDQEREASQDLRPQVPLVIELSGTSAPAQVSLNARWDHKKGSELAS